MIPKAWATKQKQRARHPNAKQIRGIRLMLEKDSVLVLLECLWFFLEERAVPFFCKTGGGWVIAKRWVGKEESTGTQTAQLGKSLRGGGSAN